MDYIVLYFVDSGVVDFVGSCVMICSFMETFSTYTSLNFVKFRGTFSISSHVIQLEIINI